MSDDAIVLGAGVVGAATAHALASRGVQVQLVDRAPAPGQGASFANGAQLSYAYTDALAAPALIARLPQLALGLDPVFRLKPGLDPGLYAWLAAFLRNMTAARWQRNTREVLELALASQRAMHTLLERHPIAFDHAVSGKMHLYYDAEGLRAAAGAVAFKQRHGAVQDILTAGRAVEIEPALVQARGLAGVVHSPQDAAGDARRFCRELVALSERQFGVVARFGAQASAFERRGDRWSIRLSDGETLSAGRLILCTGPQSRMLARRLGLRLPIQPMKGYSFSAQPGGRAPAVSITDTKRKIVFARVGDRMRVAGLAEIGAGSDAIDPARLDLLRDLARASLPDAADYDATCDHWAGHRPMTPNSAPIIRWVDPGLALNVGHGMLGWTLAMGSAARLADTLPASGR